MPTWYNIFIINLNSQVFIMKHIGIYAGAVAILLLPALAFAETSTASTGALQVLITLEDNSKLLEVVSLWSTIIIAFATTVMVWITGRKMHGGVFGNVLTFFSMGMGFVFAGFILSIIPFKKIDPLYLKIAHDSLYILGYITMGLAANKLSKVIKGE